MKLTTNFTLKEFASRDGGAMTCEIKMNLKELAINLQTLRDEINLCLPADKKVSIVIISGYRSPAHNATIKGAASKSKHMTGEAADIRIPGMTPKQIKDKIEELITDRRMKQGGLSSYNTFVHYDVRGTKARW